MVHERNTPSRPRGPHGPRDHRPHHRDHLGKRLRPVLRVRKACGDTRRRSLRLRLRAQQGVQHGAQPAKRSGHGHGSSSGKGKGGPFDILHMRKVHNVTRFGRVETIETVVPMRLRHPDEDKPLRALRAAVRAFRKDHHLAPVFVHQVDHTNTTHQSLLRTRVGCTLVRPRRHPVTQELLVDLVPYRLAPRMHCRQHLRPLSESFRRQQRWATGRPHAHVRVLEAVPVSRDPHDARDPYAGQGAGQGAGRDDDQGAGLDGGDATSIDEINVDDDDDDETSSDDEAAWDRQMDWTVDYEGAPSCDADFWADAFVDGRKRMLAAMATVHPVTLKVVPAGACPRVADVDGSNHTLYRKVGLLVVDVGTDGDHEEDGHEENKDDDNHKDGVGAAMAATALTAPAATRPWRLLRAYLHTKDVGVERDALATVAHFHRPLRPQCLLPARGPSTPEVRYYIPRDPRVSSTFTMSPHAHA